MYIIHRLGIQTKDRMLVSSISTQTDNECLACHAFDLLVMKIYTKTRRFHFKISNLEDKKHYDILWDKADFIGLGPDDKVGVD